MSEKATTISRSRALAIPEIARNEENDVADRTTQLKFCRGCTDGMKH
jgi:hypothetical protein